jgi:hypothetical protein
MFRSGVLLILCVVATAAPAQSLPTENDLAAARTNAAMAQQGFQHAANYLHGWSAKRIAPSELIPKNDEYQVWEPKNAAADNYTFMVLTAALLEPTAFHGPLLDMLAAEKRITSRSLRPGEPAVLPDDFDLTTNQFYFPQTDVYRVTYGSAEYAKDGLMPISEWLGPRTPWFERMTEMIDFIWEKHCAGESFQRQPIVQADVDPNSTGNVEAHGEMLQVLPRLYWQTGDPKYLEWATRLGDHYLLGNRHPTRDFTNLRLRDHGSEVVSGLTELYATLSFTDPAKAATYRAPIHEMLDRILEVGRNDDGLFINEIDPRTGAIVENGVADTFGYVYNAFYTVWQIDRNSPDEATRRHVERYRDEVRQSLANLDQPKYRNFRWERDQADGYADAIEGALNLYNREQDIPGLANWIDSESQVMWNMQQPSGLINEGHPDGNFARTTLMVALWKTRGVWTDAWRPDLRFGATEVGPGLLVVLTADSPWTGKLRFDLPRHKEYLHLPIDWARINQFPEWFVVDPEKRYTVQERATKDGVWTESKVVDGKSLIAGLPTELIAGEERQILVLPE